MRVLLLFGFLNLFSFDLHSQISNEFDMNSKKVFFEYQNIQLTLDQYKEEVERYNQLFDNLTDSVDIDYIGTGCSEMQQLSKIQSSPNADLIYEQGKQYTWDFLYKDLCKRTPDDNVIQFFKDLIADKESKLMTYLHEKPCPCIKQSAEIQEMVLEYYNSEAFKDINNKYDYYKPLLFKLAHDIGNIEEIADEYFLSLRSKATLSNEGILIYKLAKANKEKKALKYLELLINEVVSGEKKYAAISDEGDPFPILCLSNNKEISQKATDLMFNYFERIAEANHSYANFHLKRLVEFKDINRLKKLYIKWFKDYKQLDFTKKENRDLYRHFISYSMEVVANDIGMPYWTNFIKNLYLFDQDGLKKASYSYTTKVIGFEVVKSPELTASEKRSIFEYIRDNCEFDSYPDFYLRNLKSTFPAITLEEAKDLLPEKFKQSYYLTQVAIERIKDEVSQ